MEGVARAEGHKPGCSPIEAGDQSQATKALNQVATGAASGCCWLWKRQKTI